MGAGRDISPDGGGRRPYHHQSPDSPQNLTSNLWDSSQGTKTSSRKDKAKEEKSKDTSSIPSGAVHQHPSSSRGLIVNDLFSDLVIRTWGRLVSVIAWWIVLAAFMAFAAFMLWARRS